MPLCPVPDDPARLGLLAGRTLLTISQAAARLSVTRQAVQKAASRTTGHLLVWLFAGPGVQEGERLVDFGPRDAEPDPKAWHRHRGKLDELLRDIRIRGPSNAGALSATASATAGDDERNGTIILLKL